MGPLLPPCLRQRLLLTVLHARPASLCGSRNSVSTSHHATGDLGWQMDMNIASFAWVRGIQLGTRKT